MTEQPQKVSLEHRLLATGYDRDNFPRMDSERWLPVGLAKEAAAEIKRLSAQRESREQGLKDRAAEITRLRAENENLRRWKALDKPLTAAMEIANSHLAPLQDEIERLTRQRDQLLAALRTALCPSGGWNGMPKDMIATTQDCLNAGVCGCDQGDAIKAVEDRHD